MSFYSTGEFEHMFGYSVVVDKTAEKGVPGECIGRVGQTSAFQLENSSECAVKVELLRSFRDPHSTSPCQVRRSDRRRRRPDRHAVPRDRSRAVAPTLRWSAASCANKRVLTGWPAHGGRTGAWTRTTLVH